MDVELSKLYVKTYGRYPRNQQDLDMFGDFKASCESFYAQMKEESDQERQAKQEASK